MKDLDVYYNAGGGEREAVFDGGLAPDAEGLQTHWEYGTSIIGLFAAPLPLISTTF